MDYASRKYVSNICLVLMPFPIRVPRPQTRNRSRSRRKRGVFANTGAVYKHRSHRLARVCGSRPFAKRTRRVPVCVKRETRKVALLLVVVIIRDPNTGFITGSGMARRITIISRGRLQIFVCARANTLRNGFDKARSSL